MELHPHVRHGSFADSGIGEISISSISGTSFTPQLLTGNAILISIISWVLRSFFFLPNKEGGDSEINKATAQKLMSLIHYDITTPSEINRLAHLFEDLL